MLIIQNKRSFLIVGTDSFFLIGIRKSSQIYNWFKINSSSGLSWSYQIKIRNHKVTQK